MPKHGPAEPSDPALIAACLGGDDSAWRALIDRYRRLIYSVPVRYGFSSDEAADVFQDVCILLYEKLHLLRDHERLPSWLLTSTSRLCWARRRSAAKMPVSIDEEGLDAPDEDAPLADEELDALERRHVLEVALAQIPIPCAKLLGRLFLDQGDVSYKDISRDLRMPEGSIGPTRQRCLEKLRSVLARAGFVP